MRKRREKQERENGRACGSRQVLAGAYAPDSGIRECRGGRAWAHAAGSASGAASRVVTTGCGSVYRRRTRRRSAGGRVEAADLRLPKSMILIAFGTRPGARAACEAGPGVAHIEAGVRSHDRANPGPEEQTRVEITELARWHYAATPTAWANLAQEGVPSSLIVLTGNPIVSALARYTAARPCGPQPHILVTLHRREWLLGDCVA